MQTLLHTDDGCVEYEGSADSPTKYVLAIGIAEELRRALPGYQICTNIQADSVTSTALQIGALDSDVAITAYLLKPGTNVIILNVCRFEFDQDRVIVSRGGEALHRFEQTGIVLMSDPDCLEQMVEHVHAATRAMLAQSVSVGETTEEGDEEEGEGETGKPLDTNDGVGCLSLIVLAAAIYVGYRMCCAGWYLVTG